MNGQQLAHALHTGGTVFGTMIAAPSPIWARALEGAALDFVFIDTEHIPLDRTQVSWMCHLYKNVNLAPLVRITVPDATLAAATIDGGASGIIAPYVESADQVRELVGALKFRPLKGKRLEQALDGKPLEPDLQTFLNKHNEQNVLIVNIESTPAVENLEEILSTPGLDGVLIGPHDLSCSLGIPEQYDHPKFEETVQQIIKQARAANVGAGMHFWSDVEKETNWLRSGLNMLIHNSDIGIFGKYLKEEMQAIRNGRLPTTLITPHSKHNITKPTQVFV